MTQTEATVRREAQAAAPARTQPPRLLFFFSPTCGASRRVEGFLAQVLQRRGNHSTFRLVPIDADRCPDLVERLQVTDVPALIVLSEGRVQGRVSRPTGVKQIRDLLSPWLR
jgi:thioredoxin-like negative regulator of GroEL